MPDSVHHRLALNDAGTRLCGAGTMSDHAAIVDRTTLGHQIVEVGAKPYWSTNRPTGETDGPTGEQCWVSVGGEDEVVVIDYATAEPEPPCRWVTIPGAGAGGVVARDVLRARSR